MKKNFLILSVISALTASCNSSVQNTGSATLDSILTAKQAILSCQGSQYQVLTQTQTGAIIQSCTAAELQALETFTQCLVKPICDQDFAGMEACGVHGAQPTASAQCNTALIAADLFSGP